MIRVRKEGGREAVKASSIILLLVGSMLLGAALGFAFVGAGFVDGEFGTTSGKQASGDS